LSSSGELPAIEALTEPGASLATAGELSPVGKLLGLLALAPVRTVAKSGEVLASASHPLKA